MQYGRMLAVAAVMLISREECRAAGQTADDAGAVTTAVQALLEAGWQRSPAARQQAADQYQQLPAALRADRRLQQAQLLVLIKQQRYPDAAQLAGSLAAADPPDLLAWRAKVWIALLTKKHAAALVDLERLAAALPREAEAGPRAQEFRELARFAGLLFGFLEGPAATSLAPAQRDASRERILAAWEPARKEAFDDGRGQVKKQFDAFVQQQDQADDRAEKKAQDERDQLLDKAATQKENAAQRRDTVTEQTERMREEYGSQIQQLLANERPLVVELTGLQARAVQVQSELAHLSADIDRLEDRLRREKDPAERERLRREIDRLSLYTHRYHGQLRELERAAAVVQSRLAAAQQERARVEAEAGREFGRAAKELTDLQRQEKQAGVMERVAQQRTADRTRSHAVATRASALTTYAPFPLEEEKQKLLSQLEPPAP